MNITLNFGHYINKITKLPQADTHRSIGQYGNTKRWLKVVLVYDFTSKSGLELIWNGKATWWDVVDSNGNITTTITEDQTEATPYFQGSSLPDLTEGFINSTFKGVALSFLLLTVGGKILMGMN